MRALAKVRDAPGLALATVPVPTAGPGEIVIKVEATGICGTDLHIFNWDPWARGRVHPPRVLGHEFCGTVVEAGPGVRVPQVGEFVVGECHLACGHCHLCLGGQPHICESLEIIGVDRDGAFAGCVRLPAGNAWRLGRSIPVEVAAVMDPLGNAVHAAHSTDLTTRTVAIIGCGPIGLFAIPVCKMAGAALVAATDVSEFRLDLARRMGADLVIDARRDDVAARLRAATGGVGVDVVLEMSGNPRGITDGLRAVRNGGWVSLLGLPTGRLEVDLANDVVLKAVHLAGIFGRRLWQTWEQMTRLLRMGLDITPVITHRFPLDRFEEAFALLQSGQSGKIILVP
ncbi:MAG: L-threonine 3-dehydrogenase [Armatimonadetes bacterium]|nr:L-threonine 3-dehydrogenase [Armatimonadota bacterium]